MTIEDVFRYFELEQKIKIIDLEGIVYYEGNVVFITNELFNMPVRKVFATTDGRIHIIVN